MESSGANGIIEAVHAYLSRGWALVPLHRMVDGRCTCGRDCGKSAGKHPIMSSWQSDVHRTTAAWSEPERVPNVGIATGRPSGFWVLDYDPDNATGEAVDLIGRLTHQDGLAAHVQTGSGGWHWRFRMPDDGSDITNARGRLPAGLDVRGTGGQVVAPPSVSGKGPYVELIDDGPYQAPEWLVEMIRPAPAPTTRTEPPAGWSSSSTAADNRTGRYTVGVLRGVWDSLAGATPGGRNEKAFGAACRLHELINAGWVDPVAVRDQFDAACAQLDIDPSDPFSAAEWAQVWRSAEKRVDGKPAELPPEWTDPTRAELWPTTAGGTLPFSSGTPNAGPMSGVPSTPGSPALLLLDPGDVPPPGVGSTNGNGAHPPAPAVQPTQDRWEAAVQQEIDRTLVREEAKRRLDEIRLGDRAAARERLRAELLDGAGLLARPRLRPLVEGAFYLNTLARINGASGAGKSFVTLDLANRVARGMPWAGRASSAGRVVYLIAEGDEGAAARVEAWRERNGELGDILFLPRPVQVSGPEWGVFVELMAEVGPSLVVLDTQARVTVGTKENDNTEMGEIVDRLDDLRRATGACVVLVHHTGKEDATAGRGATAVKGALHTEMFVSKRGDSITVRVGKDKDGRPMPDAVFDLVPVQAPAPAGAVTLIDPGAAPAGGPVVPVWRDPAVQVVEPGVDGAVGETVRQGRARRLYVAIRDRFNPGDGGTRTEIRSAFQDACWEGRAADAAFRKAWARAWADLMGMGLLARDLRGARFKIVQGGFVSNINDAGEPIREAPNGYDLWRQDDATAESK